MFYKIIKLSGTPGSFQKFDIDSEQFEEGGTWHDTAFYRSLSPLLILLKYAKKHDLGHKFTLDTIIILKHENVSYLHFML